MIGVFDSGLGGLTVLRQLVKKLPGYSYVYLGDNARAPYGDKSPKMIYEYTCAAIEFLFDNGCEIVIIACNTATSRALRKIQQEVLPKKYLGKRVLGVIVPVLEEINSVLLKQETNNKKTVAVIGTKATIESKVYQKELKKINRGTIIKEIACPLLVPLIENGCSKTKEVKMILKEYLEPLRQKETNILILGCTHYPLLLNNIKKEIGKKTKVINSPLVVAKKLIKYFEKHPEIKNKLLKDKALKFYTTGDPVKFKKNAQKYMGQKIGKVKKIVL